MTNEKEVLFPIGDSFQVVEVNGEKHIVCIKCGHDYGLANEDPKMKSVMRERPVTITSKWNGYGAVDDYVIREFYCPSCALMIVVNTSMNEDPIFIEMSLSL